MPLLLVALALANMGSAFRYEDCTSNGQIYGDVRTWLAALDFDESEIREQGRVKRYKGALTTLAHQLRGRMALLIEPDPDHRRSAPLDPVEALQNIITPVENLPGVKNRSLKCFIRDTQWYLLFYSNENLTKLDELYLISTAGNGRTLFYRTLNELLEELLEKNLYIPSLCLRDLYLIDGSWGNILMPRLDKIAPVTDMAAVRKLNVGYVYNVIRMVEGIRASLDMPQPQQPTNEADPYHRFLLYFTKHGEVGPPDLSFETANRALEDTSHIALGEIWYSILANSSWRNQMHKVAAFSAFLQELRDVEARAWRGRLRPLEAYPNPSTPRSPNSRRAAPSSTASAHSSGRNANVSPPTTTGAAGGSALPAPGPLTQPPRARIPSPRSRTPPPRSPVSSQASSRPQIPPSNRTHRRPSRIPSPESRIQPSPRRTPPSRSFPLSWEIWDGRRQQRHNPLPWEVDSGSSSLSSSSSSS